jgi:putative restriction endonuclease
VIPARDREDGRRQRGEDGRGREPELFRPGVVAEAYDEGPEEWDEVRLAAFRSLEEQQRPAGDDGVLPRTMLVDGFVYEGQRVPLMGPQGIFKPRVLRDVPLSITTVAVVEVRRRTNEVDRSYR